MSLVLGGYKLLLAPPLLLSITTMTDFKARFDSVHRLLSLEVGLVNDAIKSYTELVKDALNVEKNVEIADLEWEEKMVMQSFGRVKGLIKQLEEIKTSTDSKRAKTSRQDKA
jgi:hypothetical protein